MIRTLYVLFFFSVMNTLTAQQELGLHFMEPLLQSSKTNPAFFPSQKVAIGIPSYFHNFYHSGASFEELTRTTDDGRFTFDVKEALNRLEDENAIRTNLELESLHLSFDIKGIRLSLHHAVKFNAYLNYPKGLGQLLFEGNGPHVGETLELGPNININAYNEFGLGLAKKFSKLTVGAKVKLLTGIGNVVTEKSDISLYTDDDIYQLTLNTDYSVNSSSFLKINSLYDFDFNFAISDYSTKDLFTKNTGVGFDLGLKFDVNDKLSLAGSVIDIGQIKWKDNVVNYESNGDFTYDGYDLSNIYEEGEVSLDGTLDTLKSVFSFKETNQEYTTKLPTKIYLSGNYQLNKMLKIGALLYTEFNGDQRNDAIALSANVKPIKNLSIGAVYSIHNKTYFNLGLNLAFKLGPVQIYATTDNIISAVQPYNSNNVNTRLGLNFLLFGKTE